MSRTSARFVVCLLIFCASVLQLAAPQSSNSSTPKAQSQAVAVEQVNEITCATGTACKTSFIPKFSSNGGSATVSNSIITQSGTKVGIGTSAPTQRLDLGNLGSAVVKADPGNDTSAADVGYGLIGRGKGGAPNQWWMFTAPIGGGFGVPPNSLSFWQYPPNGVPGCCLQRFSILPAETASETGGTVTIDQNGNASQARTSSGMVKAMVYVNAQSAPYSIIRCYNSNLTGTAATSPPCGFNFIELAHGFWQVDFGFKVDDRFLSITSGTIPVYIGGDTNSTTSVEVITLDHDGNGTTAYFYLLVY